MWLNEDTRKFEFHLTVFAEYSLFLLDQVQSQGLNTDSFTLLTQNIQYLKDNQIKQGWGEGGWLTQLPQYFSKTKEPYLNGTAISKCISVLIRYHILTKDSESLDCAMNALIPFTTDVENGGVASNINGNIRWFEAYPTCLECHELNGHCLSLLGPRDLSVLGGSTKAQSLFDDGVQALIYALPYFDKGNWFYYGLNGYAKHSMTIGYLIGLNGLLELIYKLSNRVELLEYIAKTKTYLGTPRYRIYALTNKTIWRLKQDLKGF